MTVMEKLAQVDNMDAADGEMMLRSDLSYIGRLKPVVDHFGSLDRALEFAKKLIELGTLKKNYFIDWKAVDTLSDQDLIDYKVFRFKC